MTPEEVTSGSIAYTGTYTADENSKMVHPSIETSTFLNLIARPINAVYHLHFGR